MNFNISYSRQFLEKIFGWPEDLRQMALKATEHVAQKPDLHEYIRPEIKPYKQIHPTTDGQYTLYFLIINNDVFFVWINDTSCLHDTRSNFEDPCQKKFLQLKSKNVLEIHNPEFHAVIFEAKPNSSKPFAYRSKYLGYKMYLNTYSDQTNSLIGHAFYCDEPNIEIAKIHVRQFLDKLHSDLVTHKGNFNFKIELVRQGHNHEIELLSSSFDPNKWTVTEETAEDDFILRKI